MTPDNYVFSMKLNKVITHTHRLELNEEVASYLKSIKPKVKRTYVYFNNDFHGYALENARELAQMKM